MSSSKKRRDATHRCPVCHWIAIESERVTENTAFHYCSHCHTVFSEYTYHVYIKNKRLNPTGVTKE